MNRTFNANALGKQLTALTERSTLLFALTCTERMLPNYQQFVAITGWGNAAVLREALDLAWQSLRSSKGNRGSGDPSEDEGCVHGRSS